MKICLSTMVILIGALATVPSAWADGREDAAETLLQPVYPLWLAQAGLWQPDAAASRPMLEAAIRGLAKTLPQDCDEARMKRDLCGINPARVPSTSMAPSVDSEETIGLQTLDYKPLRRGDIIASQARFHDGPPTLAISRLIALPGETVEISEGTVRVNNAVLSQKDMGEVIRNDSGPLEKYTETTPEGRAYSIGIASGEPSPRSSNFGPVTVPDGKYFVLGDNRGNSVDSRYPEMFNGDGFVAEGDIEGVATVIFVSKQKDRIGTPLRD